MEREPQSKSYVFPTEYSANDTVCNDPSTIIRNIEPEYTMNKVESFSSFSSGFQSSRKLFVVQ